MKFGLTNSQMASFKAETGCRSGYDCLTWRIVHWTIFSTTIEIDRLMILNEALILSGSAICGDDLKHEGFGNRMVARADPKFFSGRLEVQPHSAL